MELDSNEIAQIVEMLQHADSEDLQDILSQLGMEEQMCRQLMMTQPHHVVYDMHSERLSIRNAYTKTDPYRIIESC